MKKKRFLRIDPAKAARAAGGDPGWYQGIPIPARTFHACGRCGTESATVPGPRMLVRLYLGSEPWECFTDLEKYHIRRTERRFRAALIAAQFLPDDAQGGRGAGDRP